MIFFVLIGIILLRYMYDQVVVPPDVKRVWDQAIKEYEQEKRQNNNRFVYEDAVEPDLDLLYNKVIDFEEAFK